MARLTLRRLKNTRFESLYEKLLRGESISQYEAEALLSIAVVLLGQKDEVLRDMGYKVVLSYSLQTNQLAPLYEVSLALGYTTTAAAISKLDSFASDFGALLSSEVDALYLRLCTEDGKCLTAGQNRMRGFNADTSIRNGVVVAPTSYGKSEAICDLLAMECHRNVCIVVPTKSLVSQTRKMVSNRLDFSSSTIISHPNARYSVTERNIFILTQERLMKLLSMDRTLCFHCLVVDQAHNLLEASERARLLTSAIVVAEARNPQMLVRYLTPFLFSTDSLQLRFCPSSLEGCRVDESLKIVKLMLLEDGHLSQYDQFYDAFYGLGEEYAEPIDLELRRGTSSKNIIYLNRPINAEGHAIELAEKLARESDSVASDLVERFCHDLSSCTHPDYNLIDCAKYGVLYHHGSMAETVRKGVEYLFSQDSQCKYLVTTSTLLEGVNLPATRMFMLDIKKGKGNLSPSSFRNLIGRVCRLNEVFGSNGQLDLLQPEVYIARSSYMAKNANLRSFVSGVYNANKSHADIIKNSALENANGSDVDDLSMLQERIENFEPGVLGDYSGKMAQTEIGKICFSNSLTDLDILDAEERIDGRLRGISAPIGDVLHLIEVISRVFLPEVTDENLIRLQEPEAIRFYAMFLNWRIENIPLPTMIMNFVRYWRKRLADRPDGRYAYVGSRWGEEPREGYKELWIDVSKKSNKELINLAIVRIQEEQEFVDNRLLKYMDILHEYGILDEVLWRKVRYGTTNEAVIRLLDNGMGHTLINLLEAKYRLDLNLLAEEMCIPIEVYQKMKDERENMFILLEAEAFVREGRF